MVAAFNFYDDKYGFETNLTCGSAFEIAQKIHSWLGAAFDPKKLQLCRDPTILGVTYDLQGMRLLIKESRKKELVEEIESILTSGLLSPGQAGKLRGKLMFGASQLWGKVGRAFLRALSERQYAKFPKHGLNAAITLALKEWRWLVQAGPPRLIEAAKARRADLVLFTDGSFPDGTAGSPSEPWIGGALFRRGARPLQFGSSVSGSLVERWLPRKSQIVMVELLAVVVALETFRELLKDAWILLFVDSEPVQGALVKGYSAKEDLCELVGVFWRIALNLKVCIYVDRVPTDSNPADAPSRDRMDVGGALGWASVQAEFPKALSGVGEV